MTEKNWEPVRIPPYIRTYDGTGRHGGLKILRYKACEFKFHYAHNAVMVELVDTADLKSAEKSCKFESY